MKEISFADILLFFLLKVVRGYANSIWGKSPVPWPFVACVQTPHYPPNFYRGKGPGDMYIRLALSDSLDEGTTYGWILHVRCLE